MGFGYGDLLASLRRSYDAGAGYRDGLVKPEWMLEERAAFLERLRASACRRLLEVGAGTGQDSEFFAAQGLNVIATDASPQMVDRCRAKGLDARVADFLGLGFPLLSFDAVYAFNCLLHVPNADLPGVLAMLRGLIRPGGLCFIGVWGGDGREEIWAEDTHVPPRFFSLRTDDQIQDFARAVSFEVVDFHVVARDGADERFPFQSLTLRSP